MKAKIAFVSAFLLVSPALRADDSQVIAKLAESKISLIEGIRLAEKASGPATSAKFELDDGKLSLSVYTAPKGLQVSAEQTDLTEISGDPTVLPFKSKAEVFKDKEHIARASVHMTLMQISRIGLVRIIQMAQAAIAGQPYVPYSVANPAVRNHEPIADVYFADSAGRSLKVSVNMRTGEVLQ